MKARMCLAAALVAAPLAAQSPSFEVVSLKHIGDSHIVLAPGEHGQLRSAGFRRSGNRLTCALTLSGIVSWAFSLQYDWQISGAPWISSERYQLSAVTPEGATSDDARRMVQAMLADRLGFQYHREQKEFAVFALTVAPGGPHLEEVPNPGRISYGVSNNADGVSTFEAAPAMPLSALAGNLAYAAHKPVLDQTGLTGFYKIKLQWMRDPDDQHNEGMLSTLPKLGLRLEPRKAAFDVVIVERVNREPTAN